MKVNIKRTCVIAFYFKKLNTFFFSYIYDKYGGGVSWSRLVQPSIDLAENGFTISKSLAHALKNNEKNILNSQVLCEIFCERSRASVLQSGSVVRNILLAKTLKIISLKSSNSTTYFEDIYFRVIKNLKDSFNFSLSLQDLKNYEVKENPPFEVYLSSVNKQLLVPSTPSGGPLLAAIMTIFDQFSLNSTFYKNKPEVFWQSVVECFKHAFGFSLGLGDSSFEPKVKSNILNYFKRESLSNFKRKLNGTREAEFYKVNNFTFSKEVKNLGSHISVLGLEGESVSITSSIGSSLGSLIACNNTGIVLNDALRMFSNVGKVFGILQIKTKQK